MRRILQWLIICGILILAVPVTHARADTTSSTGIQSSYFSQDNDSDQDVGLQAPRAGNRPNPNRLAIPDHTPTPLEGFKWKKKKISIYMDTDDPKIQWAFRDAVKRWNKVKAVKIYWTKDMEKADIIANDGDLSGHTLGNNDVGYTTSELGSTKTEYDPDTNALHQATSTLDPNQLDYTSKPFRSKVAQHELGHALGLAHAPEYENSVMIPRNIKTGITKNDAKTLRMLYRD